MNVKSLPFILSVLAFSAGVAPEFSQAQAVHPQWSKDGAWIAYYERIGQRSLIHRVRPDGSDHVVLVDDNGWYANPSWLPNGDIVAARAPEGMGGRWDLANFDSATGAWSLLMETPEREMHTSVSPDGSRIAFVRMAEGASDVWMLDAHGDEVRLTDTPTREFHPKWSPDGQRLAFDESGPEGRRIHVLDVGSGEHRVVALAGVEAGTPAWIDDATLVFAVTEGEGRTNLYVTDVDGGEARPFTALDGQTGGPSVSPDGKKLALHSSHEGGYAIYVMLLADGSLVRVSPGG